MGVGVFRKGRRDWTTWSTVRRRRSVGETEETGSDRAGRDSGTTVYRGKREGQVPQGWVPRTLSRVPRRDEGSDPFVSLSLYSFCPGPTSGDRVCPQVSGGRVRVFGGPSLGSGEDLVSRGRPDLDQVSKPVVHGPQSPKRSGSRPATSVSLQVCSGSHSSWVRSHQCLGINVVSPPSFIHPLVTCPGAGRRRVVGWEWTRVK